MCLHQRLVRRTQEQQQALLRRTQEQPQALFTRLLQQHDQLLRLLQQQDHRRVVPGWKGRLLYSRAAARLSRIARRQMRRLCSPRRCSRSTGPCRLVPQVKAIKKLYAPDFGHAGSKHFETLSY
jgi:hypothetical protein